MKKGTRIGWILVAVSLILSVWVIASPKTDADTTVGDYLLSDDETTLIQYVGAGGEASAIPSTVTTIASSAFAGTGVTSVSIPSTVTSIGDSAFYGCVSLSTVSIEGSIAIPDACFYGCSSLAAVSMPGVTSIGSSAFGECVSLGSFAIPSSCTSVSSSAFDGCLNMTDITADSSTAYSSYDGCLYNAGGTQLIIVPKGKTAVSSMPATCTSIAAGALSGTSNLQSIYIPSTVTTIDRNQTGLNPSLVVYYDPESEGSATSEAVNFVGDLQAAGYTGITAVPIGGPVSTTYTVNFYQNDGTTVIYQTQTVTSGATATQPTAPTRTGYNFSGWYTDAAATTSYDFTKAVTANLDLYAGWTTAPSSGYTVTCYLNDGTSNIYMTQTVASGGTATKPTDPTRSGYTFTNWYTESGCTNVYDFTKTVSSNLSLYAGWTAGTTYTVTFNSQGGSTIANQTVKSGGTATEPTAPTYSGYTFGGWYTDSACTYKYNFATAVTANLTLYAKWTANSSTTTYRVIFMNGAYPYWYQDVTQNGYVTRPADPSYLGVGTYAFVGWYTNTNYTTQFNFATPITTNMVLYAGYKAVSTNGTVPTNTITGSPTTTTTTTPTTTTTETTYVVNSDGSISHTKDATPKTADEFDNRILLCIAIALAGIGIIIYGKYGKMKYIAQNRRK